MARTAGRQGVYTEPNAEEVRAFLHGKPLQTSQVSFPSAREVWVDWYLKNTKLGKASAEKISRRTKQASVQSAGLSRKQARRVLLGHTRVADGFGNRHVDSRGRKGPSEPD